MDFSAVMQQQVERFSRALNERRETLAVCALVDGITAPRWTEVRMPSGATMQHLTSGRDLVPWATVWWGPGLWGNLDRTPRTFEIRSHYYGRPG